MSGVAPTQANVMTAIEIKSQAAAWLERSTREDWCAKDQGELDAWLAISWAHSVAYWRLKAAWSRAGRLVALHAPMPEKSADKDRRISWRSLGRTAAILVVLATLGIGAGIFLRQPDEHVYTTALGGHETITLADGTSVELNTDTLLRAEMSGRQRTIWLDRGEAYFQVKHDAAHPFVVMVGDRRVTDLGTKFLIRRDTNRLEVSVVEGRVWFDSSNNKNARQSALLLQGDAAVATANTLSVAKQSTRDLTRELGWRHGVVVFDNASLADAAAEFNRYNREKIFIADPAVGRQVIGATFPINDVERFVRVAQDVLGVRAVKRGDGIVISR